MCSLTFSLNGVCIGRVHEKTAFLDKFGSFMVLILIKFPTVLDNAEQKSDNTMVKIIVVAISCFCPHGSTMFTFPILYDWFRWDNCGSFRSTIFSPKLQTRENGDNFWTIRGRLLIFWHTLEKDLISLQKKIQPPTSIRRLVF